MGWRSALRNELQLLDAMYPGCIAFDSRGRELKYFPTCDGDDLTKGVLVLRLPHHYPAEGLPDLITVKDSKGLDARTQVSDLFSKLAVVEGEEALDAFILAFQDFINESAGSFCPPACEPIMTPMLQLAPFQMGLLPRGWPSARQLPFIKISLDDA